MAGVFKKLSANDIKITPFEAHKQYDTTDLASIGASTASLVWSGSNKSNFNTSSRKYYQIDKLYYRNYIEERAVAIASLRLVKSVAAAASVLREVKAFLRESTSVCNALVVTVAGGLVSTH